MHKIPNTSSSNHCYYSYTSHTQIIVHAHTAIHAIKTCYSSSKFYTDCPMACSCTLGFSVIRIMHTTLRLLLLTASKFSYFVIFCIFRVLILAILDHNTMILMIFIVIDDVMFYSHGQILTIITNSLKFAKISTRL